MSDHVVDKGVYASAELWRELRHDPAFVELIRLARVTNSLALAYTPLLSPLDDQSPRTRRDRFSALVYAGALLHEGMHVAQGLGRHFRTLPQYKAGFAVLFGDKAIRTFRSNVLDKLRDELVFHFDRDALSAGLSQFPDKETLLLTAPDFQQGLIHFDVADDALLGALFGDAGTEQEYLERVTLFLEGTSSLFNRFMRAAHSLIPAVLLQMGCYIKDTPRPLPPTDDEG